MLTDADIGKCLSAAGCYGSVKMTFESGPYCIDRPSHIATKFARAIESAARSAYKSELLSRMESVSGATEAEGDAFTHGYFCGEDEATAPLLAEIERLKATLAASCDDEREQLWEACPGGGCSRALDAERRIAELEAPQSTLSWGGFNLHGDIRSIVEANRLLHEANTVPELKARIAAAQASNAQAEPLVLERLSISEAKTIVSQHVEGEMTGDDWTIINAVQSAIAAKNGATLK